MYRFTILIRTPEGVCGGKSKFKSFETAKARIKYSRKRYTVLAWAVLEDGRVVEQSGRI